MKKFWVYVHTCKANGKRYVGITTYPKPEIRWKEGRGYEHQLFGRAILKYGWDNFEHEVFEVDSAEEMYRKEIELISFYHSNDPKYGYNCSTGGEKSALGYRHSEEVRKKISEDNLKKWADPEYRKKMSEDSLKRWADPEYRKKLSKAHKERWSDPEFRRKMSEANEKKWADPEIRKRIAESHKGKPRKPCSEETRKKISEAKKGKPKPRIKISLPDGTVLEITKQLLVRDYVNKNKAFQYVS